MAASRLVELLRRAPSTVSQSWPARRLSGRLKSGWRVYFLSPVTGQVGPAVDPLSGSWSIELNGIDSGAITVRKDDLARVAPKWFGPWTGGVLLTYIWEDVERPITGGPVTGWPSESEDTLDISWAGPRKILEKRVVRAEGTTDNVVLRDISWGSMAWELIRVSMAKPGGQLPIVHGSPAEEQLGVYRQFESWNLGTAGTSKRLQEITDQEGGPDLMLRPEWSDDSRGFVRWRVVHGTVSSPVIAQDSIPDWDTTAARANVETISIRSTSDHLATRVWATGAGEGRGTVVAMVESTALIQEGGPLLETVVSDSNLTAATEVRRLAADTLAASGDMVDQISISVRADDPKTPLGTWHVGDKAHLTVSGWLTVRDGTHPVRIIKAAGDLTNSISIDFQEDAW